MAGTAANIETSYINAFRAGFEQSFQQFDSVFMPYIKLERQASEFAYYDRIGVADAMTKDTTRYGDNPISEIEHGRRRMDLQDYEIGKYIDEKDIIRVATDPTNPYTMTMTGSGFRQIDDIIIDRVFGDAFTGKSGQDTITFPSTVSAGKIKVGGNSKGHSNPVTTSGDYEVGTATEEGILVSDSYGNLTNTASGLTIEKLKAIRFTMLRLEAINQDQNIPLFIGYRQFQDLLGIEEVINSDYATRKALAEGSTTSFLGFTFIHTERLKTDSSSNRRCIVLANNNKLQKYAMRLAIAKSLTVNMWRDSSKKNIPYLYFKLSAEASRFWGEVTAEVKCSEL